MHANGGEGPKCFHMASSSNCYWNPDGIDNSSWGTGTPALCQIEHSNQPTEVPEAADGGNTRKMVYEPFKMC